MNRDQSKQDLYRRHSEIVMNYFNGIKLLPKEISELAHIRKKLNAIQTKEMFGGIRHEKVN